MKGFQNKFGFTQGIIVPSDGRSGGLALLWREGTDIRFKSCSHSHIDAVVHREGCESPWKVTGFYRHPNTGKWYTSWQLLETLNAQCSFPWLVCGDFNEIVHSDEKVGWKDRDAEQMGAFRETLSRCGLFDLGFVGPNFTWCNGRFGEQRTLIRLDRMVANEAWSRVFPDAKVHHVSMSSSDHCLLALFLRKDQCRMEGKKRFFFEAMWTREKDCKELVELAWDPCRDDSALPIQERLERCQKNLQDWNKNRFGNIYKGLRQKQTRLQQLESLNLLHDTVEEIQALKREINELHIREEIMWNQRSRVMWLQHGDKNTKFFHAIASQRRWKNRIGGLIDDSGIWHEDKETIEQIILDYFKSIFSSNKPSNFDESLNALEERVSPEMNEELQRDFKAEEVWTTFKQMHPTKAPGQTVCHLSFTKLIGILLAPLLQIVYYWPLIQGLCLDVAKRAGPIEFESGQVGFTCIFQISFFFSFFFFNYKNKSMTTCLERMNKIN